MEIEVAKHKTKYGHFIKLCVAEGLPAPIPEVYFAKPRMWRWDMAWPTQKVCVEIMGGLYRNGGHNRGPQYEKDMEKFNAGQLQGWCILQFTPAQLYKVETYELIRKALNRCH